MAMSDDQKLIHLNLRNAAGSDALDADNISRNKLAIY